LRPRPKGPEAEARGYEAEAKILALRPVWPRGFNISDQTLARLPQRYTSKFENFAYYIAAYPSWYVVSTFISYQPYS